MSSAAETFREQGYVVLPSILTAEEVARLRQDLRPLFDRPTSEVLPGDSGNGLSNIFARNPELRWLLFHPKVLAAWREVIGDDFAVIREQSAHLNQFDPGWHSDAGSQERFGHLFHRDEDYLMAQTVFYLQDDTAEFAGGLEVGPGTHRRPSPSAQQTGILSRVSEKLGFGAFPTRPRPAKRLWSRAGDMVLFDFRTWHRATQPRTRPIPPDHDKLAVYVVVSKNNRHVRSYHDHILERGDYLYLSPDFSYPTDLLDAAGDTGVILA